MKLNLANIKPFLWKFFSIIFIIYFILAFFPKSSTINSIYSLTLVSMSCITAIFMLFSAVLIHKISKKYYLPWLFISFAYISFAIGDILSHLFKIGISGGPYSILVNAFYLLFYPLFFIGITNLPFASMDKKQKINLFLEIGAITLSVGIIFWAIIFKPFLIDGKVTSETALMILSAPIGDIILLWFILKVLFKKESHFFEKTYKLLALGTFILIISDLGFSYMVIHQKEIWSLFIFLGFPTSQAIIIFSALEFILTLYSCAEIEIKPMRKRSYSYAPIIIAYASFASAYFVLFWSQKDKLEISFVIFIPIIILLSFTRQLLSIIENNRLFDELKNAHNSLEERVKLKTIKLSQSYDETLNILSKALELRDRETQGHTLRLADLTVDLSRMMGIENDELINIKRGALLHDIGKMGIPDNILLKPGPLDQEEWKIMKKHPQMAKELIEKVSFLKPAFQIPYYHHERWNGKGYPEGLKGKDIPLEARVFSVLDTYDALTHNRPYRSAWEHKLAVEYIIENSGILFDPEVVNKFKILINKDSSSFIY